ncbi:MAG: TonB-dependent receptor plug domain-containing protein [Congregibacter sp.]
MTRISQRASRRCQSFLPCLLVFAPNAQLLAADEDLFELSLGELLNLQVTSVSKKSQPVSQAAAAVFVITAEDIRRSGATAIPEILRMAPGIEVAQVDANKWAVSARGFQNRFANKLLVLMDGRTLYSPLFSGVFWDAQDTLIEDIERIEVIRGPGATLWGSNAVNGVINIITRDSRRSSGTLLSVGAGNQEPGKVSVRHGGALGDAGHYRIYAKHFSRDGNTVESSGLPAADDWHQTRIGFRADIQLPNAAELTVQGDTYDGDTGETFVSYSLSTPYLEDTAGVQEISGYNLLARYSTQISNGDQLSMQGFVDYAYRDWALIELDRTSVDIDIDYRLDRLRGHDLLFGMNYRFSRDDSQGSDRIDVQPSVRDEELISVFAQDDWELVPDKLSLIAGLKLELNDYTGYELQPNLRLLWRPDTQKSLWASVARAVRTPGRLDRDVELIADLEPPTPPGGLPTASVVFGNRSFESEVLIAYEAGFKIEASEAFAWDLAVFLNDYEKVRTFTPFGARCEPGGLLPNCLFDPATQALAVDFQWSNVGVVDSFGAEWAGTWQPSATWRFKGAYSYIDQRSTAPADSIVEVVDGDPRHQLSLRIGHQPKADIDLDMWLRYVDEVPRLRGDVDAYTTLDLRLAWRPLEPLELSLSGRNLLDSSRVQFRSELEDVPRIEIQRAVHLQLTYEF